MATIDKGALESTCAARFDEALSHLGEYVSIPCLSPAFDPDWERTGELSRAAFMLIEWIKACGFGGVELVELPGRTPLVYSEIEPTHPSLSTTTLLYGHFDKQPPLGTWRAGLFPFRAVEQDDRLYGRGSADDGYACFSIFSAIGALHELGLAHGRVVVLLEACEESGSPDLEPYLDHLASRIGQPDLIVCLDSGGPSYDRLWLTSSLRGVVAGTLCVSVLDEAVHSGLGGGIVPSSFRLARSLLSRVEDEATGELLLPELNPAPPAERRAEVERVAEELGEAATGSFPTVEGLLLEQDDAPARLLANTWGPALEVIGQEGLPAISEAGNVLRPSTSLRLSFRLPPNADANGAASALERALTSEPPMGAKVSFVVDQIGAGWDAPPLDNELAALVEDASRTYFGNPPGSLGIGGSIPFMASLAKRYQNAQFLATGVLGPGSNAHGPNESLYLPAARALTAAIAHLVCGVA